MQFDQYTITILMSNPDAPQLEERAVDALQDAHMAHLADLHQAGQLLAAGPLLGAPDRAFRGLAILNIDPAHALQIKEQDPAVRAGRYTVVALPWIVPSGAMTFAPARFPRNMVEAQTE